MKDLPLVTAKQAILAKKLGFNELCNFSLEGNSISSTYKAWRNSDDPTEVAIPTIDQIIKWLGSNFNTHLPTKGKERREVLAMLDAVLTYIQNNV